MVGRIANPAALDAAWRAYSRPVLATLLRLLRDFDLAEEALHEAFLAAARRWPQEGTPHNPIAWLVSVGRYANIDRMRKNARFAAAQHDIAQSLYPQEGEMEPEGSVLADDQLRLIFLCCHPMIASEAQVALVLREVCGLTTEEIARAFLARTPAIAQRIVRAKARLKQAGLPYEVPGRSELPSRRDAVLRVIYLLFNEGYSAHGGDVLIREDLCATAIGLGQMLCEMLPDADTYGLLGLMLIHHGRRAARQTAQGDIVLFPDQDRSIWDTALIDQGHELIRKAFANGEVGAYALQGAIAAVHTRPQSASGINWAEIVGLYDLLMQAAPSPVVQLNRAAAIFMAQGIEAGQNALKAALVDGALDNYGPAHATAAHIHAAAGETDKARAAYLRALDLCHQEPERRLLQKRLDQLGG